MVFIKMVEYLWIIFFFKLKTSYEMRISDWSSDVCSSDLALGLRPVVKHEAGHLHAGLVELDGGGRRLDQLVHRRLAALDRTDVELGRKIGRASCRERVCQYV